MSFSRIWASSTLRFAEAMSRFGSAVPMREFASGIGKCKFIETQECETFWVSQFGSSPDPDLPTSRPRPPVRTFDGIAAGIAAGPVSEIRRLAKDQKNSYFAVLLAAFQVWLHRLSGANDIVVGVPFAAQSQLGMDTLVGQCANTLPIRAEIGPAALFSNVLERTGHRCSTHRNIGILHMVDWFPAWIYRGTRVEFPWCRYCSISIRLWLRFSLRN